MKNSAVLRTAVVGLGRIAWEYHIPQILKHEGFSLAAVVDPLPERIAETVSAFKIARGYQDCKTLLQNEKLDLIVIASPTIFHLEQTIQSFEHGCDVFCDKPVAVIV